MQYPEALSSGIFLKGRAATAAQARWMPALCVAAAFGVLLVSFADGAARSNLPWAEPLFWLGFLVLTVPIALRIFLATPARSETIGLLLCLGVGLYLVKVLHSPLYFTFFDEFLHFSTADHIAASGHLFGENALLPVSSVYPGLEILTNALMKLSGLGIFEAGVLVIGVARVLMVLGLYLFFEQISASVRLAGMGTLFYMTNSKFFFFDAQYAYESLALPLAVCVLVAIALREQSEGRERRALGVIAAMTTLALVITHHGTSFLFVALLVAWGGIARLGRWGLERQPGPGWLAALAAVAVMIWLFAMASFTIEYFRPHIAHVVEGVAQLLARHSGERKLFTSDTGDVAPLLERLTGMGAAVLPAGGLLVGLWVAWKRHRSDPMFVLLALGALLFPVCIALRLTGGGWEIGARLAAFVYLPLGFVLALAAEYCRRRMRGGWLFTALVGVGVPVLFAGGLIAGWSPYARLPWPYHVVSDSRSIEPQGIAAANWARTYLGPNNRLAADQTNSTLMGSYGGQRPITNLLDKVVISGVFLSPWIGDDTRAVIRTAGIRYLVVDRRVSAGLPYQGHYYEDWEQLVVAFKPPVNPTVLAKWDDVPHVSRVFDSGDIRLYDVGALPDAVPSR